MWRVPAVGKNEDSNDSNDSNNNNNNENYSPTNENTPAVSCPSSILGHFYSKSML
jgi:hypothetical protein